MDISKLVFGGAVITTALNLVSDKVNLIIMAVILAIAFALCGIIVLIYRKR